MEHRMGHLHPSFALKLSKSILLKIKKFLKFEKDGREVNFGFGKFIIIVTIALKIIGIIF